MNKGPKNKRNVVLWDHFEIYSADSDGIPRVKCKHCPNAICRRKNGSTAAMRTHLRTQHQSKFTEMIKQQTQRKMEELNDEADLCEATKEAEDLEAEVSTSKNSTTSLQSEGFLPPDPKKPKLAKSLNKFHPVPCHSSMNFFRSKYSLFDQRQLEFDLDLMKLLVECDLPFTFVQSKGFQSFCSKYLPRHQLKSATTFSRQKLPLLYEEVKKHLSSQLANILPTTSGVSFTTDLWTSRNNEAYISISLHFIDENFELQRIILACKPFPSPHTGQAIGKKLDDSITELALSQDCLRVVVHDCAANMKSGSSKADQIIESLLCIDHMLNLVLSKAVDSLKTTKKLIKCATNLSSFVHQSTKTDEAISKACKQLDVTYRKIIPPVVTRWNSNCLMLDSILQLKTPLLHLKNSEADFSEKIPNEQEFELMADVQFLLKKN